MFEEILWYEVMFENLFLLFETLKFYLSVAG